MRISPYLMLTLLILVPGCVQTGCMNCDDGNPCTFDACESGQCVHKPLSGPMEGCSGAGGCLEYGCFNGGCIPQMRTQCCGNGQCDPRESFLDCPMDCKPTCFDGMQNQGEEGVDCGGPCNPCEDEELNYLRKLGTIRGMWFDSAENYTSAIKKYNSDKNDQALATSAMKSYGNIDIARALLLKTKPPKEPDQLKDMLDKTMGLYMDALNGMVMFIKTRDDNQRLQSNKFFDDALNSDRAFVWEYNRRVGESNDLQTACHNFQKDAGEESVDCGGTCKSPCSVVYNVTKFVTLRNEGGAAHITLNISSPAIDYQPVQKLAGYYLDPIPDSRETTPEGNQYYAYDLNMPPYGVKEFKMTETVRLYRYPFPSKAATTYFNSVYLVENNLSQTTEDICFRALALKKSANSTYQAVQNLDDWIIGNIRYEVNSEEMGAQWCFLNRKGACDEQADLFVSLARCDGIAARRLTGSLVNGSQLTGHAWGEFYDGNDWVYVDPSVKSRLQGFTPDNKHITACVGEGAYQCGLSYVYTYTGNKPKITLEENVYLS